MSAINSVSAIDKVDMLLNDFGYESTNQAKVDTAKMFILVVVFGLTCIKGGGMFIASAIALFLAVAVLLVGIFNSNRIIAIITSLLATVCLIAIYYNAFTVAQVTILIYVFIGAGSAAVQVKNESNAIFTYVSLVAVFVAIGTTIPMLYDTAKFALLFVGVVMIFIAAFSETGQILITEEIASVIILIASYVNRFDVVLTISVFLLLYNFGKFLGKHYSKSA